MAKRIKSEIEKRLLIDEIVADIVNGVPKSEILLKLQENIYQYQPKAYIYQHAYNWYNWALDAISKDSEDAINEKRQILWSRYENLYRESLQLGNLANARQVLTDMAKVFGLAEQEQATLTLNGATIKFNFNGD